MRAVSVILVLCFALAIYSAHRILSETHLHAGNEPSPVPGMSTRLDRETIATLDQAQRIRAWAPESSLPRKTGSR